MDNLRDDDRDLGQRGDENRAKGTLDKITGKVQEGVGKLTHDPKTEAEGKMRQAKGNVREGVGNTERKVDDTMDDMRDRDDSGFDPLRDSPRDRDYDRDSSI